MGCGSSVQIALGVPAPDRGIKGCQNGDCTSDVKIHLTNKQMKLVKSTWRQMESDYVKLGSKVFFRIFDLNPCIKSLFPFKDIWGDSLLNHQLFKAHAGRFMNTLDQAISNLHMVDTTVAPQLYNLGKTHAVHVGFKPEYFLLYRSSITYVFQQELGQAFTDEVAEAWAELLLFITTKLKEGYEKGQSDQKQAEQVILMEQA